MRTLLSIVALIGLGLFVTSCEELKGPSANNGLFMARLQDCKDGYIPSTDNFGPGEAPAVVFSNYNGLTVTVRVYDQHSGGIVWNRTEYIPRDRPLNWWSLKTLPSGAYKAELLTGNTLRQSYNFNVARAASKTR